MSLFKKLELEWKILLMAAVVFIAFAWPIQRYFVSNLSETLTQSIDPQLEQLLRKNLNNATDQERQEVIASIKRNRQWQALLPIIIAEQKQAIFVFTCVLSFFLLLIAIWTLKRLTQPLKNLSFAVDKIGKGTPTVIDTSSGGALGRLENTVLALSNELDQLRERARVQGMEAAWQDIARVMAHEIKNPLTPIRLSLDRLEERTINDQDVSSTDLTTFVQRINSQVDSLERLVNQFRSFSREPEVHLKEINLSEALSQVAQDMSQSIKTEIRCTENIIADPYLLNQILLNIWKNALEAGANAITVWCKKEEKKITLSIKDNGPGIEEEKLERVWLPYFTLKEQGSGLGLAVVKKLTETMQGSVALQSQTTGDDHGLCVMLTFNCTTLGDENR